MKIKNIKQNNILTKDTRDLDAKIRENFEIPDKKIEIVSND